MKKLIALLLLLPSIALAGGATIQQIKARNGESLWHFLAQLPVSVEAQILYAFALFSACGMAAHYLRCWLNNEITGSLFDYLFRQHVKRTLAAYTGAVGAGLGLISTGAFVTPSDEFVGWLTVVVMALTLGYSADSVANKGSREEWTPQMRAQKTSLTAPTEPGKP